MLAEHRVEQFTIARRVLTEPLAIAVSAGTYHAHDDGQASASVRVAASGRGASRRASMRLLDVLMQEAATLRIGTPNTPA